MSRAQLEDEIALEHERLGRLTRFHHDFETYSDLDIKKVGGPRYVKHKSTRPLMLAYAFDDEEPAQWVPAYGEPMPGEVREALRDPEVVKLAWNVPFEWGIWAYRLGIEVPHEQWRDPMVLAHGLSLPGRLKDAGPVLGLPKDKLKDRRGDALIRLFCSPQRVTKKNPSPVRSHLTHPEEWSEFLEYNIQDVIAERACWKRMRRWSFPREEWENWFIDREINERGLPISRKVVENATRVAVDLVKDRLDKIQKICSPEDPNFNGNSRDQLLPWLQEEGYVFDDLKKGHIARALETLEEEIQQGACPEESTRNIRAVLALRKDVAQMAHKKYVAVNERMDDDDRLRGTLQFCGAGRTWRWAGRNGYQPQNLKRPGFMFSKAHQQLALAMALELDDFDTFEMMYPDTMEALGTGVRLVVQAGEIDGEAAVIVDADLNAIENRVLGWVTNCMKILEVFWDNRDPYIDFGKYMFHSTYEELWHEYTVLKNKARRQTAKPAVLGAGYGMGPGYEFENEKTGEMEATGLLGYAWNMNIKLTQAEAKLAVDTWRDTYSEAVDMWYALERAAKKCIKTGKPQTCGVISFDMSGPFMRMILPGPHALYYVRPQLQMKETPWGEMKETITYEQQDERGQWARVQTRGAKLIENAVQAIARDILASGVRRARAAGLQIILHVHDQILIRCLPREAHWASATLVAAMQWVPRWARGRRDWPDLPLRADAEKPYPVFLKAD